MLRKYEKLISGKFRTFVWFRNFVANQGFSLIEVIISLALVLSTLLIFGAVQSTVPLVKTSRSQNLAYHIAGKKIEELRNTPFASLPASGSFVDPGLASLASSTASLTMADYGGSDQIKKATVSVTWAEGTAFRSVVLETLMASGGLNQP